MILYHKFDMKQKLYIILYFSAIAQRNGVYFSIEKKSVGNRIAADLKLLLRSH